MPSISLLLIGLTAALTAIALLIEPNLDLAMAGLFFDDASGRFPLVRDPLLNFLRGQGGLVVTGCMALAVAAVVVKLLMPSRLLLIPGRAVIFLVATLAIGPGIMVNGIFKDHWSRPRPVQVTEFGGAERFMQWWDPRGTCERNCSFVSGEVAVAAWTLGPAILVPAPWRIATVGAALVFTLAMAFMRMAFGAHFFTDVMFAFLMTALVIWTMHGLIFRWPRTALGESSVDRAIERFAKAIRGVMRRRRERDRAGVSVQADG